MNAQPRPGEGEQALPDSNTLGGTTSTGAGPDGTQTPVPTPDTLGLGHDDLDEADEVSRRIEKQNSENKSE